MAEDINLSYCADMQPGFFSRQCLSSGLCMGMRTLRILYDFVDATFLAEDFAGKRNEFPSAILGVGDTGTARYGGRGVKGER